MLNINHGCSARVYIFFWFFFLTFLFADAAPTIDDQISEMEIDTLLHSGTEDPDSPYMGVFVSRADDVDKAEYLRNLSAEGSNQYYRFLAEFGIVQVEFVKGGSLALEECSIPTRFDMDANFAKMGAEPPFRKLRLDYIDALPQDRKISALRRVTENLFLMKRFEYVKRRYARPKTEGNVNLYRTPQQEADAVYKQLFQSRRPLEVWPEYFDLSTAQWEESSMYAPTHDVPLKLIAPYDQADDILPFLLTDQKVRAKIGQRLEKLQKTTLPDLRKRYTKQYRDYFYFRFGYAGPLVHHLEAALLPDMDNILPGEADLLYNINQVRHLRVEVLELYDQFRFPFPDARNPQFHIWVYDPEHRVQKYPTEGFLDLQSAMKFYDMVVSAFKTLPAWVYSGVLHDVMLCKTIYPEVAAFVDQAGHVMAIQEINHASLLIPVLEHEVAHVANFKFHERLSSALHDMDRKAFTRASKNYLTVLAKKFSTDTTVHFSTYLNKGMRFLENQLFPSVSQHAQSLDADLRDAHQKLSPYDCHFLSELKKAQTAIDFEFLRYTLTDSNVPFFTSRYASVNANEEAAELIRLVLNPVSRAQAFLAVPKNDVKREKIKLALSVLSRTERGIAESRIDVIKRVVLVHGWRQLEKYMQYMVPHAKPSVIVYVRNEIQSPMDEAWEAANRRVEAANLAGDPVSYILLLPKHGVRPYIEFYQQITNPANSRFDIIFYGIEDTKQERATTWNNLFSALTENKVNYFGQLASVQEVFHQAKNAEALYIYSRCSHIRI